MMNAEYAQISECADSASQVFRVSLFFDLLLNLSYNINVR